MKQKKSEVGSDPKGVASSASPKLDMISVEELVEVDDQNFRHVSKKK
jgi:hypothetical protein